MKTNIETWDKFQCEECGKRFAVEALEGEIIDEPICPVCGFEYVVSLDNVRDAE